MSELGYYPGCSLSGTAREYDLSLRAVAGKLGVQLKEVPEWICCGASSAHAVDHEAALVLASDTLLKARSAGLRNVLAPCAMCYQRLASAARELREDGDLERRVSQALGADSQGGLDVRTMSLLDWLDGLTDEEIKPLIVRPLQGLKVACYYGCLLVRPPKVTGVADPESPRNMERMLTLMGAQPVRWSMATECCGGSFALSHKASVLRLVQRIAESARKSGAQAICMACPMCHANVDMRQLELDAAPIPALYVTQLMGLAMGMDASGLGLDRHFVRFDIDLARSVTGNQQPATRSQ